MVRGKDNSNPEWLNSLLGDSPLLSSDELNFLAEIRSRIVEEARNQPDPDFGDESLNFKLSRMKDHFERIVEHLRRCPQPRNYFIEHYGSWRFVRQMNIGELMKIAKDVEKTGIKFSIASLVGSTVSLIGGILSLTAGDKKPLFDLFRILGRATSAASSACEVGLLLVKIERAEKIIEEDREFSQKLWSWLSDGSFLDEALEEIKRVDVLQNLQSAAEDLMRSFNENKKRPERSPIEKEILAILKSFGGISPGQAEDVADIVGILVASAMICQRHAPVFNLIFHSYKLKRMVPAALNLIRALASAIRVAKCEGKNSVGRQQSTTKQKLELGIDLALDGIDVALVLRAMQSENEMAKCIEKAAEELKRERDLLDQINERVTECF